MKYLWENLKGRTVPIEAGSKYTDSNWGQELLSFDDFLESFETKGILKYLAQHPLLEQVPSLKDDIEAPDYCFTESSNEPEINAWIGPKNTISSLHTDNKFNLFCQIRGAKYFILVDPASTAPVPTLSNLMFNSSDLDVEAEVKMPESKYILRECVVKEGDVLYIPKLYWHYVKSLSASVSISVWFD